MGIYAAMATVAVTAALDANGNRSGLAKRGVKL
jgi:hypothetical protein